MISPVVCQHCVRDILFLTIDEVPVLCTYLHDFAGLQELSFYNQRQKWLCSSSSKNTPEFDSVSLEFSACSLQKVEFIRGINITESWVWAEGGGRGKGQSFELKLWLGVRGEAVRAERKRWSGSQPSWRCNLEREVNQKKNPNKQGKCVSVDEKVPVRSVFAFEGPISIQRILVQILFVKTIRFTVCKKTLMSQHFMHSEGILYVCLCTSGWGGFTWMFTGLYTWKVNKCMWVSAGKRTIYCMVDREHRHADPYICIQLAPLKNMQNTSSSCLQCTSRCTNSHNWTTLKWKKTLKLDDSKAGSAVFFSMIS